VLAWIELGPLPGLGFALVGFAFAHLMGPWAERRALDKSRMPPSDLIRTSDEGREPTRREGIGFFLMLFPRGLALWVVWPVALGIWILRIPATLAGRQLRVGQIAGWLDRNLIALLESTMLRPFFPRPTRFAGWSHAQAIERGPSPLDLW